MSQAIMSLRGLSCGYGAKTVVRDIWLEVFPGEILSLLGPNGAGKTSLFRAMLGLARASSGEVLVGGRPLRSHSLRERAGYLAYVPQAQAPAFAYRVLDVVLMGRCARLGVLGSPGASDERQALDCLDRLGCADRAESIYGQLSGGERQMVLIARSLAQGAKVLIMDEPSSNLDFGNQARLLSCLAELASQGLAVVMTTHFPDHPILTGGRVALMKSGRLRALGQSEEILTEAALGELYGVEVRILREEREGGGGLSSCLPVLRRPRPSEILTQGGERCG